MRVGLLPVEKVVPFLLGRECGLFEQRGLELQVEIVGSAAIRDDLFRVGRFDVVLMNVVSAVPLLAGGVAVRGLTVVERSSRTHPMFSIVAAPRSRLCADGGVATSIGTIAEYVASTLGRKLFGDALRLVEVPDIESRVRMVVEGEVPFAVLPEPASTECIRRGCVGVADDRSITVPPPMFVCRTDSGSALDKELGIFRTTYMEAVGLARSDPWRAVAVAQSAGLAVQSPADLPSFPDWDLPTLDEAAWALSWWADWKGLAWASQIRPEAFLSLLGHHSQPRRGTPEIESGR